MTLCHKVTGVRFLTHCAILSFMTLLKTWCV